MSQSHRRATAQNLSDFAKKNCDLYVKTVKVMIFCHVPIFIVSF